MIWAVLLILALAASAGLCRPLWRAGFARAAMAAAVMLIAGSILLYLALGRPDLPDAGFAERAKAPDFALRHQAWDLAKQLEADPSADGFARLGAMLAVLNRGRVGPAAGEAFARALELDPRQPQARFYAGLALYQRGQSQQALAVWRALEKESKPDAPWMQMLQEHIAEAEAERKRPR